MFALDHAGWLEALPDAVVVRDQEGTIAYWNQAAERLYGWNAERAVGSILHDLLQTELPETSTDADKSGHWFGDLRQVAADGRRIVVSSRWAPVLLGNAPGAVVEVSTDVTAAREAEEERRRSDAAFHATAEALTVTGSFRWNIATGEIYWSPEMFRIFGVDPAQPLTIEFIGTRIHPEDLQSFIEVIMAATEQQQDFDYEHRLLLPDGTVRHIHAVGRVYTREPLQFMGAMVEITARKQAEEDLRNSEFRYRNLFGAMAAAFWEVDFGSVTASLNAMREAGHPDLRRYLDGNPALVRELMQKTKVLDVNDQTISLFGRGDKNSLLTSFDKFWPEGSESVFVAGALAALGGERSFSAETRLRRLDGSEISVVFTASFPRESIAEGKLLIGVVDVSDRVRAQEMLQRVQAEFAHASRVSTLGELTASIAHELNQPLATIAASATGSLRWLEREEPDIREAVTLIRKIESGVERASSIITRVRDMALRRLPVQGAVDLNDVIREASNFLRQELQAQRVLLALDLSEHLPLVSGDRTQLQQVVVNLAVNASQALQHGSSGMRRILVRSGMGEEGVQMTVEDSGPGIPPDHLDRLFESFFTTKENGLGIGLPICRSIVHAHGGRIEICNRQEGGARVTINLPALG